MTALTLVGYTICPFTQRANIALREHGVAFDATFIGLGEKPAWLLAISPLGRVPLLKVARDGRPDKALFESGAIQEFAEDVGAAKLYPSDPVDRAEHRAWVEFAGEILADTGKLSMARTAEELAPIETALQGKLKRLDDAIGAMGGAGPFFAGAGICNVDVALAPTFVRLAMFEGLGKLRFGEGLARVGTLAAALLARPSVAASQAPTFEADLVGWMRGRGAALLAAA